MIEVFKTNVRESVQAALLVERIQAVFAGHKANFDLQDCDNILRVECRHRQPDPAALIGLLKESGFYAEVLPDDCPVSLHRPRP